MVRKISQDAAEAFLAGREFKRGNTEVSQCGSMSFLKLYDNVIAVRCTDAKCFDISTVYSSRTTLDRLNALPGVQLNVRRGMLYFFGKTIPLDKSSIRIYYSGVGIDFDKLGQILED